MTRIYEPRSWVGVTHTLRDQVAAIGAIVDAADLAAIRREIPEEA